MKPEADHGNRELAEEVVDALAHQVTDNLGVRVGREAGERKVTFRVHAHGTPRYTRRRRSLSRHLGDLGLQEAELDQLVLGLGLLLLLRLLALLEAKLAQVELARAALKHVAADVEL